MDYHTSLIIVKVSRIYFRYLIRGSALGLAQGFCTFLPHGFLDM